MTLKPRAVSPLFRVYGERRFHADGELHGLHFAADDTLWSIEETGALRQWDPDTGRELQHHALSDLETLWAFNRDGSQLASASDDLTIWDAATGDVKITLPQPFWVTAMAFSPDPNVVATGHDDHTVRLWNTNLGQLVGELKGHERPISALAFSPEGRRLATAGEDRVIHVWNVADGRRLGSLPGHTDRISGLDWHPQGNVLVSAGWDTTARVWDLATWEPIILLNSHADQVTALAFQDDGRLLACADSAQAIHIWDVASWKTRNILRGHTDEIRTLAFSRDGRRLASGGADRVICLWDPERGQPLYREDVRQRHAIAVAQTPDGLRLAMTRDGAGLQLWDVERGKVVRDSPDDRPTPALACSPDGRWLVTAAPEAYVRLHDASTGERTGGTMQQTHTAAVMAFGPDSKTVATANTVDGTVWLWDVLRGEPLLVIPGAADGCSVETLAFHPNGRLLGCGGIDWLATGGSDGAVCLWDLIDRCQIAMFEAGAGSIAFDPAGQLLAVASLEDVIWLFDVASEDQVGELPGHKEGVLGIAFSPDGRWLAAGGGEGSLRLWDVAAGKVAALVELETPPQTLCFSPDGRWLFTGNANTTAFQLDLHVLLR